MAVRAESATIDLAGQQLLAVWAIKTAYLVELASRQQYSGKRPVEGYEPSSAEMGWLLNQLERHRDEPKPPPRSFVWLAGWDCKKPDGENQASMLHYAPSRAPVRTPDGGEVAGHFTTLAIGFAAFQVFTVDYVQAGAREAEMWNTHPPPSLAEAIRLIWPHRLRAGDIVWPPLAFPNDQFDRLASWGWALRRGVDREPRSMAP
ncbi:MAG TPA: hypothetical protein VMA73_27870 [Streptosporangiaceae bacterium]|nr:hypothetical protein [Streptosporangiaceae bacterium]